MFTDVWNELIFSLIFTESTRRLRYFSCGPSPLWFSIRVMRPEAIGTEFQFVGDSIVASKFFNTKTEPFRASEILFDETALLSVNFLFLTRSSRKTFPDAPALKLSSQSWERRFCFFFQFRSITIGQPFCSKSNIQEIYIHFRLPELVNSAKVNSNNLSNLCFFSASISRSFALIKCSDRNWENLYSWKTSFDGFRIESETISVLNVCYLLAEDFRSPEKRKNNLYWAIAYQ